MFVFSHNCFYCTSKPDCAIPDDKCLYMYVYVYVCGRIVLCSLTKIHHPRRGRVAHVCIHVGASRCAIWWRYVNQEESMFINVIYMCISVGASRNAIWRRYVDQEESDVYVYRSISMCSLMTVLCMYVYTMYVCIYYVCMYILCMYVYTMYVCIYFAWEVSIIYVCTHMPVCMYVRTHMHIPKHIGIYVHYTFSFPGHMPGKEYARICFIHYIHTYMHAHIHTHSFPCAMPGKEYARIHFIQ
jgi:hypothetical protein